MVFVVVNEAVITLTFTWYSKKDCNLLQVFENYVKDATAKLSQKVEDLDDVRFVMAMLKEVSH